MVLLDTSVLAHLLFPTGQVIIDNATGHPVTYCQERLQHFVQTHQKTKIVIAAPSFAEFLVHAGERREDVIQILKGTSAFKIVPFDEVCALECAMLEQEARVNGGKRGASTAPWQKVKVDRQILAIALVHNVSAIYTDDTSLKALSTELGLPALGIADMPLPDSSRQHKLDLPPPDADTPQAWS
ncbi:type II toxin-antitoxin system VapC family toxin [Pseudomonas sp. NCHU5208]|uniref:type II toxin-antitoxin system VapC family toxin n=1 Tax=unclassified Pseudomonas TaxID=196821 RepID=UPI003F9EB688